MPPAALFLISVGLVSCHCSGIEATLFQGTFLLE